MSNKFVLSPSLIGPLLFFLLLVVGLAIVGKVPLSYNIRNLLVRWRLTLLTALAFTLVVAFRLKQSSLGRAMISVREDEFAAQSIGVNVARVKVLAFMMAAFFAGAVGRPELP